MKVAQVTTVHPGTENRIAFKEGAALHDAGHEVHLIAPKPYFSGSYPHHMIRPSQRRLLRPFTGYYQVWSRLRSIRPDIVHAHDPELIPLCLAYRLLFGARFVFDAHENLAAQIASKHYLNSISRPIAWLAARLLERLADYGADAVVVAEAELVPIFQRNRNVAVVRNFPWLVAEESFSSSPTSADRPTIGYVGAIAVDRGFRVMQAIAERSKHKPKLRLAGRLQPNGLQSELSDDTDYIGPISPSELPEFLDSLDIGLCLLRPEPNYVNAKSTKIYEYMLASKPFLYSDFPAWVSEHGADYGLPVDPEDVVSITSRLDSLLDDPAKLAAMGSLGRARMEESYSFDSEAQRLIQVYQDLYDRARRS